MGDDPRAFVKLVATNRRLLGMPPQDAPHLHATDEAADSCPLCFPGVDSDDPGQPCTGCGVTLFGYNTPRCEWCAHADEARADERQRIRDGSDHWPGGIAGPAWYKVPADLLDGDADA